MDSFHVHLKLSSLKRLGSVIRFIEICVLLVFISRISFQLQFPVGEYAKRLFSVMLGHRFVFVIGNVIVITLFAKSKRDSSREENLKPDTTQTRYFIETGQKVAIRSETQSVTTKGAILEAERDMGSVPKTIESSQSAQLKLHSVQNEKLGKAEPLVVRALEKSKACFKRSYSECLELENCIKPRRILRRTATEGCRGVVASGGRCPEVDVEKLEGCGDGMSDEEFRVMVETFIAKQQRCLREEEKYLSCVKS